jgi:hypothetical protein
MNRICFLLAILCLTSRVIAAGPSVHIVVGEKAEAIERFAAEEMAGQLKKLFDAEVKIAAAAPTDAANVIYLGTKQSSPLAEKLGEAWPPLSEQDQVLKSLEVDGKKLLLVAGGSPRAVLWAAYELGWRFGIRYFPFGDIYPTAPTFTLDGFDVVIKPNHVERVWYSFVASPIGPEAWGLDEHRQLLGQLAKLKYTEVTASAPAIRAGSLVAGRTIVVDGDTVGRSAFRGAKTFDNPDFSTAADEAGRRRAAEQLVASYLVEAERLGLTTAASVAQIDGKNDDYPIPECLKGVLPTTIYRDWATLMRESANRNAVVVLSALNASDAAFDAVVIGRMAFEPTLTPQKLLADLLDPICGEGVAERVHKAFEFCSDATGLIAKHDATFSLPRASMLTAHYDSTDPPPAWWGELKTHYLNAMNEMYRANTRAREGGRVFTLYYARRFEFGFEYMNACEALRKAAIAKKAGKKDEQIAELEMALDSITACCNAMAAVSRSNSDRGIIAVMNEYGYRPVTKLLEEADAGN